MTLSPPVFERFDIMSRLGSGSFGTVYEALDRQRDRVLALKTLDRVAPDTVLRFKSEFRRVAGVRHPNLASVYELLVLGDHWLLTMELVRGVELLEHLALIEMQQVFLEAKGEEPRRFLDGDETVVVQRRPRRRVLTPLYLDEVRAAFQQLAVAIAVLHANGLVHRDIKPSNVMMGRDGRVVVLDFGLAVETSLDDSLDRAVVGTPGYMSPEQIAASAPVPASDWYGFGALLHQALTGKLPYEAPTTLDLLHMQVTAAPPRAEEIVAGIPEDLSSLAYDCLQRDPAGRPTDAEVLARIGVVHFDPARLERARERPGGLVGRSRELRSLTKAIAQAEPGEPRLVLLHGPPGIGKSALLDHVLDLLRAAGDVLILAGRCQPWESLPYNAVDALIDALTRELRRNPVPAAEEILSRSVAVTELFPALEAATSSPGEETVAVPSGERFLLRAAAELRALIDAVAGDRAVLLVLDDAQWGDYQSARVLTRLLGRGGDQRVVLLLSYTFDDWRTSLLLQALDPTNVRPAPTEVALGPLSRTATAELIRHATGRSGKTFADAVHRQSGGNPMLARLAMTDSAGSLAAAATARLATMSAAAREVFQRLLRADGPLPQNELEEQLELFVADEAIRTLAGSRLVRIRRTGNLSEVDLYHPRMRDR